MLTRRETSSESDEGMASAAGAAGGTASGGPGGLAGAGASVFGAGAGPGCAGGATSPGAGAADAGSGEGGGVSAWVGRLVSARTPSQQTHAALMTLGPASQRPVILTRDHAIGAEVKS